MIQASMGDEKGKQQIFFKKKKKEIWEKTNELKHFKLFLTKASLRFWHIHMYYKFETSK